jgi:glycosyltransferase involved in cell wall biosynthesis
MFTPDSPTIAILVCTHNGEAYLEAQLRTLAEQTHRPAAVFIHDWGSKDGTVRIAHRFADAHASRFPVIVHRHEHAPGASASFLQAIRACLDSDVPFEHLALCDQDDLWSPDKLATYAGRLQGNSDGRPDVICSDVRLVSNEGEPIATSYYAGVTVFRSASVLSHPSILLVNPVIGMTLAVSRRCLRAIAGHFDQPWLMHDWALVLLALDRGFTFDFVARPLVDYRQHGANVLGASMGWRIMPRLRKSRRHFARIRGQIALLAQFHGTKWAPLAVDILRGGAAQRFHAARAAVESPLLGRASRWLLGGAILLLW